MLLDTIILDYIARCPLATAAQNTNNTTIRSEGKLVHLEQPMTPLPYPVASQATRDAYEALNDVQNEVACLMLGSSLLNFRGHLKTTRHMI
ncbi:hypothetical protein Tco_0363837 [Tanacetum coccineum]